MSNPSASGPKDDARGTLFRLISPADLPPPHGPFKCHHSDRFLTLQSDIDGTFAHHLSAGNSFLQSLTLDDLRSCAYHLHDWRAIGAAALTIYDEWGPLVPHANILSAVSDTSLDNAEALWLWSIFADPIVISSAGESFVNGQHRACGLRFAGVDLIVVEDTRSEAAVSEP